MLFYMVAYVAHVFKQRSVTQIHFKNAPAFLRSVFALLDAPNTSRLCSKAAGMQYSFRSFFYEKRWQTSALDICHLLLLFFIFLYTQPLVKRTFAVAPRT